MRSSFKYIYEDLLDNSKKKGPMAFIFKTKIHVMIVFAVFSEENISYESLSKKLTNVSRSTIHSILAEGVKLGYFEKKTFKDDKRIKYYSCSSLEAFLEKWYERQRKVFSIK